MSVKKTLLVALGVSLVCAVLVSSAAVVLNDIQETNKKLDKLKNILKAADLYEEGTDIRKTYNENIRTEIIDLSTGEAIPETQYNEILNIEEFDIRQVAQNPNYSETIPANLDIAQIKRRPSFMPVYYVMDGDSVSKMIMPIYGKGLWSTMYGFIAIGNDLRTIQGFNFYEHGETPGLGGEVDNPAWQALWPGKQAFDEQWNVSITVIKGQVEAEDPDKKYKIDGLSGSTITTRGVDNLVRYWLSDGYAEFFANLREEGFDGES